jgi:hypothetical protein
MKYLAKEIIEVQSNYIKVGPLNLKMEDFKEKLEGLENKAIKDGLTDLTVQICYESGDEDTCPSYSMSLCGKRLETEEEWHKKLEDHKRRLKRELETAQAIVARSTTYDEKNKKIDAALETSTLRCEKCNKPCSYKTSMSDWKKSKRICNDCCNILREEMIKK